MRGSATSCQVRCPRVMSGTLTGNVSGSAISMGVMMGGGVLGQATFTGIVTIPGPAQGAAAAEPRAIGSSGTYTVTSGPVVKVMLCAWPVVSV